MISETADGSAEIDLPSGSFSFHSPPLKLPNLKEKQKLFHFYRPLIAVESEEQKQNAERNNG